jgi:hypothetical protein
MCDKAIKDLKFQIGFKQEDIQQKASSIAAVIDSLDLENSTLTSMIATKRWISCTSHLQLAQKTIHKAKKAANLTSFN